MSETRLAIDYRNASGYTLERLNRLGCSENLAAPIADDRRVIW